MDREICDAQTHLTKMNSKTKTRKNWKFFVHQKSRGFLSVLLGILVIGIILIGGWWILTQERAERLPTITKEQAIAIANATDEAQEFLKLYPNIKISAEIHSLACDPVICGWEANVVYSPVDIDVSYARHYYNKRTYPIMIFDIDAETGKLLDKYPKLEYIKNETYCEYDEDCKCFGELPDGRCCDCINFIHLPIHEKVELKCLRTYKDCKCLYNTCMAIEEKQVTLTTDKTEYEHGESITVTIENNLDQEIYLSSWSFEGFLIKINNTWNSTGGPLQGMRPYVSKKIHSKGRISQEIYPYWIWQPNGEIYRIAETVYFGCKGVNYSSSLEECVGKNVIYSNEFTIKEKTVEILTPSYVLANSDELINKRISIGGTALAGSPGVCTEIACSPEYPCCNDCSGPLTLKGDSEEIVISGEYNDTDVACFGNECFLGKCYPLEIGKAYIVSGVWDGNTLDIVSYKETEFGEDEIKYQIFSPGLGVSEKEEIIDYVNIHKNDKLPKTIKFEDNVITVQKIEIEKNPMGGFMAYITVLYNEKEEKIGFWHPDGEVQKRENGCLDENNRYVCGGVLAVNTKEWNEESTKDEKERGMLYFICLKRVFLQEIDYNFNSNDWNYVKITFGLYREPQYPETTF